jgi:hypothetical protein
MLPPSNPKTFPPQEQAKLGSTQRETKLYPPHADLPPLVEKTANPALAGLQGRVPQICQEYVEKSKVITVDLSPLTSQPTQ